jgi:hypothetical protein
MKLAGSFVLALTLGLTACGSKDDDKKKGGDAPDFVEQTLQGKINGKAWTFAAGRVEKPSADSSDPSWTFELVSEAKTDVCSEFGTVSSSDKLGIIFSTKELAVGRKNLAFSEDGQTITLFDSNEQPTRNSVASDGFLEVTAIAAGSVQGKMVAYFDENDVVNGNFTVTKCCPLASDKFTYEVCKE